MQTITTKYLGPTNYQGSRLRATHTGGAKSVTVSYRHALDAEDNHREAALELAKKLNWKGQYIGGHTKEGMVWVHSKPMYNFKA